MGPNVLAGGLNLNGHHVSAIAVLGAALFFLLDALFVVMLVRRARRRKAVASPSCMAAVRRVSADTNDPEALLEEMIEQGRAALLLRPQVASGLSPSQRARAQQALFESAALVPEGEVYLGRAESGDDTLQDLLQRGEGRLVRVGPFFLDRYPITNRQYYEFVAAGGYEQISYWDQAIWPEVLEFVDRSGQPGPRFWRGGCFEAGREDHPVVGVSWHEASAYARWSGKRIPTDAEWVKAASWPVGNGSGCLRQRKYPWGDTMDRTRANLWGSGPDETVPVTDFPGGMSVGGIYQLVGNVWEWTRGNYAATDHPQGELMLEVPLKIIRGGAYDTYFDNHAACQFPSGEAPTARKRNIGFRCAVGACDLAIGLNLDAGTGAGQAVDTVPQYAAEEVAV